MKNVKILSAALVLGVAGNVVLAASADTMWVVENQTDTLWTVDVATLQATQIGNLNTNWGFGGLGFYNGTLYGRNTNDGGLYTIDTGTGNATLVGTDTLPFGLDTFDIDPTTGQGIGLGVSGEVWDIDLSNGAATFIANTSAPIAAVSSAFDAGGTLYEVDRNVGVLNTIDTTNGNVTVVGPLGFAYVGTSAGYNFNDGLIYVFASFDSPDLYSINTATGAGTFVGTVNGLPSGGVQYTAATFNIPAPGTAALFGLGGLALARRRR
jgi:uncharacterized protein (TIGR03382 family)